MIYKEKKMKKENDLILGSTKEICFSVIKARRMGKEIRVLGEIGLKMKKNETFHDLKRKIEENFGRIPNDVFSFYDSKLYEDKNREIKYVFKTKEKKEKIGEVLKNGDIIQFFIPLENNMCD